jgi:hypothetical protein
VVWLQKQTGCGRGANGEVTATADWWAKEIKVFEVIVFFSAHDPRTQQL